MVLFWLRLLFRWIAYLSVKTLIVSSVFSFAVTLAIYIYKGMPSIDNSVLQALAELFRFWLMPLFVIVFLVGIPFSLKVVFNYCFRHRVMRLYCCDRKEVVREFTVMKQLRFFRGWFMFVAWVLIAEVIAVILVNSVIGAHLLNGIDIISVYVMFVIAGCAAFYIMFYRFNAMRIEAC